MCFLSEIKHIFWNAINTILLLRNAILSWWGKSKKCWFFYWKECGKRYGLLIAAKQGSYFGNNFYSFISEIAEVVFIRHLCVSWCNVPNFRQHHCRLNSNPRRPLLPRDPNRQKCTHRGRLLRYANGLGQLQVQWCVSTVRFPSVCERVPSLPWGDGTPNDIQATVVKVWTGSRYTITIPFWFFLNGMNRARNPSAVCHNLSILL